MRKSLIIVIVSFIIAVVAVNLFVDAPVFSDPKKKLDFVLNEKQNDRLDLIYLELLVEDSLNIDYHYGLLLNYFQYSPKNRILKEKELTDIYWAYADSPDYDVNDIGYYCLGLYSSMKGDYNNALLYFTQVSNDSLKYLNNSIGKVHQQINDTQTAEDFYKKAILYKGNLSGAYSNLIDLYYTQKRFSDLYTLLKEREARKYFPSHLKRYLYLSNVNVFGYFRTVFSHTYQNQNLVGFIGALLVMLSWLFYLRRIDIYEPEKWRNILLIFILGIVFSEFTFLLSDLSTMFTGFNLNGKVLNDLLYCILGIGVIEELVKILPVILILRFTRAINEPVDYLVYGSVSALGFAFAENLLYFNNYGAQIIMGRALTAVVFHMFLTSLAAYGLMLNKYKSGKGLLTDFTKYFLLAAIIHGLYDFWLINQAVSKFGLLSMVMLVFCFSFFNTLISNALSNSEFFDENVHLNKRKLQNYLIYSLSFILMFQYLVISFKFGHEEGWQSLKSSLISGGYLIIFISANMGTISIKHRKWKPLQLKLPKFSLKLDHNPNDVVGEGFDIEAVSKNRDLRRLFPNKGKIIKRETVSENPDWYLFELENKKEILEYNGRFILIKSRYPNKPIKNNNSVEVAVFVFISDDTIEQELKHREDFLFKGWAKLK
ncbi:MAG: PrsW family intramembrane metalloprotease [Bacteroidales bacterium]|nr:PrsW family intramembrane metalloprotease [Bacteroidales bacterium]